MFRMGNLLFSGGRQPCFRRILPVGLSRQSVTGQTRMGRAGRPASDREYGLHGRQLAGVFACNRGDCIE